MGPGNQQETDENSMSQSERFGHLYFHGKVKISRKNICNYRMDILEQEVITRTKLRLASGHHFSFSTTKTPAQSKTTIYRDN